MRPVEAWQIARSRLEQALGAKNLEGVTFVLDSDVRYEPPGAITVPLPATFGIDGEPWNALLEQRPTWLHANLLHTPEGVAVVTLRRSAASIDKDDERSPAVNVSIERGRATFA